MPMNRREFIKIGAAAAIGVGVASAIEIPILENSIQNSNNKVTQLQNQDAQVFLTLNPVERKTVEALAEAIIPTDSNGPGAKEAAAFWLSQTFFTPIFLKASTAKGPVKSCTIIMSTSALTISPE